MHCDEEIGVRGAQSASTNEMQNNIVCLGEVEKLNCETFAISLFALNVNSCVVCPVVLHSEMCVHRAGGS